MLLTSLNQVVLLAAALLLLATHTVLAVPLEEAQLTQHAGLPEGYSVSELRMIGTYGDNITINHTGTVEQIFAQLAAEHAHVDFSDTATVGIAGDSDISKRAHSDVNCIPVQGQNWYPARIGPIESGIDYLNKVKAQCVVGPHSCVRISCSYNGGIHLCNNNDYLLSRGCGDIATYASAILDKCTYYKFLSSHGTGGQAWDTENFNICIYNERC
ncbi:hypothetical protein BKA61DRAFT_667327 [Leptodontidium sp. MPI-SDFR-AT-0119]|nr:hypothetical protein BKA61DRAFT_667327 [Leptodontidium sp. MPI-SDFR-AT-0119]